MSKILEKIHFYSKYSSQMDRIIMYIEESRSLIIIMEYIIPAEIISSPPKKRSQSNED